MTESKDLLRMNSIELQMQEYLRQLELVIAVKSKAMERAPGGSIHVLLKKGKRTEFFVRGEAGPGRERYLKKSEEALIDRLLQKRYDKQLLSFAQKAEKPVREFLEKGISLRLPLNATTASFEQKIEHWIEPDDVFRKNWEEYAFRPGVFREDYPEYFTEKGERVRSKSEILIANMLLKHDIPYRYECPLTLESGAIIHPDFTVLDPVTRRVYYLEHFGMMDDKVYARDAIERIAAYQRSGFLLGRELLVSFETGSSPLNIRNLENELRARLDCF